MQDGAVYTNDLAACLRELRDVKMRLASCSLSQHYRAWCGGRCAESAVIRSGAIDELQELLALERWLASLAEAPRRAPASPTCDATEIDARCRVLRLVRRGINACNGDRRCHDLKVFLSQLGAVEAGRVHAVSERDCPCAACRAGRV